MSSWTMEYTGPEWSDIVAADKFAELSHTGQTRRDGSPYVEHPRRVAKMVSRATGDHMLVCTALIHDVFEDTKASPRHASECGVPDWAVVGALILTHNPNVAYMDYIEDIADTRYAIVKLMDIMDNLMDDPSERQVKKYREAIRVLTK